MKTTFIATLVTTTLFLSSSCDDESLLCVSSECMDGCQIGGYLSGVCSGGECECIGETDGDGDGDVDSDVDSDGDGDGGDGDTDSDIDGDTDAGPDGDTDDDDDPWIDENCDYYVRNGGNDDASGLSDENAWATIARVNSFAETAPGFPDGSVVCFNRGDIWSNDETLGFDGSIINWQGVDGITFRDYGTGAKPRFDANTQQPIWIYTNSISNVTIRNIDCSGMDFPNRGRSHIELWNFSGLLIDGVEINGHTGASSYQMHFAFIRPYNIDGNIEIRNCILQNNMGATWADTESDWGDHDANLINIKYRVDDITPKTSGVVTISNNVLHDVWADCILLSGIRTTETSHVDNNVMYNFGENAIDLKSTKNIDIHNNEMSRGTYGTGGSGGGNSCIGTHSTPDSVPFDVEDIIIRDNEFHNSAYRGIRMMGRTINSQIHGNTFTDVLAPIVISRSPGTKVYNNVFVGREDLETLNSIYRAAIAVLGTDQDGVEIYDNSIYLSAAFYDYGIYIQPLSGRIGMAVTNNIVQMTQASADPLFVVNTDASDLSITDNCWHNSGHTDRVSYKGTVYDSTEQADWRAFTGGLGVFSDPLFTDPAVGDLSLQAGSPCSGWGRSDF